MKYRDDHDLDFFRECSSAELNFLVEVLIRNKNGELRSIVQLPNHYLYKQHEPDHAVYWEVIAGEVQRYGSNPLAALARAGRGKHYIKILSDVCGRFGVQYIPSASVDVIERTLYVDLFSRVIPTISPENLQLTVDTLQLAPASLDYREITKSLNEAMRLNDSLSCAIALIVAHAAAMHASSVSYEAFAETPMDKVLKIFHEPLAAELEKISPLSLTGSAHWIVIPTVLQVAYLRAKKNAEKFD